MYLKVDLWQMLNSEKSLVLACCITHYDKIIFNKSSKLLYKQFGLLVVESDGRVASIV